MAEATDIEASIDDVSEPAKVTPPVTPIEKEPIGVKESIASVPAEQADAVVPKEEPKKNEGSEETKPLPNDPGEITDAAVDTVDAPDLHINQFVAGKYDAATVNKILNDLYPSKDDWEAARKNPISFYNFVIRAFRDGWGSNTTESYMDVLTQTAKSGKKIYEELIQHSDKSLGKFGDGTTHNVKTGNNLELTGENARQAFMAKLSGLKRVKLINSGFWVTIRRPQIFELQDIFDCIDLESKEVGYEIGAHNFALVTDLYIKRRFLDALIRYRVICDSNLVDIYDSNNFLKALSFHDYEVLLHAVLSLLSRKGLRARMVCPQCHKATVIEKVDVDSSKYYNRDLITDGVTQWWNTTTDKAGNPIRYTVKDCKRYREEVLNHTHSYIQEFSDAKIEFVFKTPTMYDYLQIGENLIAKIRNVVNEKSVDDEDRRRIQLANLAVHAIQMIAPWIKSIKNIEDGDVNGIHTSDIEAIMGALDVATQEDSADPLIQLNTYLAKSKMSYIGSFALECPFCHAKPDVGADQFYPLEVQTIFFGQLFRLLPVELTQTGS